MPEWIRNNPDGSAVVRADDGREVVMPGPVASRFAGEGMFAPLTPQQADPIPADPAYDQFLTPPQAQAHPGAPASVPTYAPPPVPESVMDPNLTPESLPQSMRNALEATDKQQGTAPAPKQAPAEASPTDAYSFHDPSAAAPQAPVGPQYATATSTNTTRSTTKTVGGEEDIAALQDSYGKVQDAQRRVSEVDQELADNLAGTALQRADSTKAYREKIERIQEKKNEALDAEFDKLKSLKADVKTAIDEGNRSYWADRSTGSQIMAVMAAALGGAAQAYVGGPNQALQQINRLMEADYKRKQDNVRHRKDLVTGQYDLIDAVRTVARDETEEASMVQSIQTEELINQAEAFKEAARSKSAKDRADILIEGLRQKQTEAINAMRPREQVQTTTTSKRVPVAPAVQQGGHDARFGNAIVADPGIVASLRDTDVTNARAKIGASSGIVQSLQEMEQIANELGGSVLNPKDPRLQRYNELRANLAPKYSVMFGQGAQTDAEFDRFVDRLPDLNSFGSNITLGWGNAGQIQAARQAFQDAATSEIRGEFGLVPSYGQQRQVAGQRQGVAGD